MTLKILSGKKNPTLNLLKLTLKKQTPITLLFSAFTLLICPGLLLKTLLEYEEPVRGTWSLNTYFLNYALGIFLISLALMFVLLLVNFSFLFFKKTGDLYHALPVTRNELLFTRAFATFIGAAFNLTASYACLAVIHFLPMAESVGADLIINTYLLMLLFLLTLTVFTLLFVVTSGGIFDFIISLLVVNLGLPAIYLIFANFVSYSADGLQDMTYYEVIYTTPFAFAVYKLGTYMGNYKATDVPRIEQITAISVIGTVVLLAVCIIAASKLFHKRKSETAGEAYSFKFVPNIISVILSVVGGYLVSYIFTFDGFESFDFWIFFQVGAALCSITFGVISTRGFKTVWKSLLKAGIAVVLTFAAVLVCNGIVKSTTHYVPKVENIKSVQLFYHGDAVYTDKFELITDMHSQIIENIDTDYHDTALSEPEIIDGFGTFRVVYKLKGGIEVTRTYPYSYIFRDNLYDDMLAIMQTEESSSRYNESVKPVNKVVEVYCEDMFSEKEESTSYLINEKQARQIIEAYKSEMMKADMSVFGETCRTLNMNGKEFDTIRIPESFTETYSVMLEVMGKGTPAEDGMY